MPGRRVPNLESEPRLYDRVRPVAGLAEMPVIVADEIAAQIDAMPELPADVTEAERSYPAAAYGIVAPPFAAFFVEATTVVDGHPVQRGMVVYDRSELIRADGPVRGASTPVGTHWQLHAYPFLFAAHISPAIEDYGSPAVLLHIDAQGELLDDPAALQVASTARWPAEQLRDAALAAASFVPMVLKAIGALHRRAPVEQVTPEPVQLRQARRQHNVALHSYYRLKVKPHMPTSREDFASIGTPARAAAREHVVRGHFRYYGPDAPLFGRTVGAVWVPEHSRGDDAIGTIRKDYEVEE